jgi:hypothetical protein
MKLSAALVFTSVLFVATEAHTSGGYGNSIATSSYCYTFIEHVRKSFSSGEQSRAYMKEHDRRMKTRFITFQAKAERAVKKSGLPVAPYDLFLPAVHLAKPSDVSKIDKKAYPLNLVIDLGHGEADERFEITLTKPITAAQLAALKSALKSAVKIRDVEDDGTGEREAKEQALIDAAKFEVPVAVTQIDEGFGLYVGTTTEVPAAERERVVASLQATLDKLLPKVRESFAAPDIAKRLNVEGLQPLTTRGIVPQTFNPWGPLSSGDYVRNRNDMGRVSAILMVAPVGKHEYANVYPALETILNDAGAIDAHRTLIEDESERLDGIER